MISADGIKVKSNEKVYWATWKQDGIYIEHGTVKEADGKGHAFFKRLDNLESWLNGAKSYNK